MVRTGKRVFDGEHLIHIYHQSRGKLAGSISGDILRNSHPAVQLEQLLADLFGGIASGNLVAMSTIDRMYLYPLVDLCSIGPAISMQIARNGSPTNGRF